MCTGMLYENDTPEFYGVQNHRFHVHDLRGRGQRSQSFCYRLEFDVFCALFSAKPELYGARVRAKRTGIAVRSLTCPRLRGGVDNNITESQSR